MPPDTEPVALPESGAALTGPERVIVAPAAGVFAWPDERIRRYQPVLWMAGRAA